MEVIMIPRFDIGIFGGDNRQVYMALGFLSKGYSVATYHTQTKVTHENCTELASLNELFESCNVLVGPIPMSRDKITIYADSHANDLSIEKVEELLNRDHLLFGGQIPSSITKACGAKGTYYYDLMKDERITILNAIATAEGTIMEAIAGSDRNLHASKCLVLGYGRCAKVLAAKLKSLDAHVLVAARSEDALAFAQALGLSTVTLPYIKCILPSCDYIFNTIPSLILTPDCLDYVNKNACIIDIASAPGGLDYSYAEKLHLNAKLCLGLPGKIAPWTSAEILITTIQSLIKERSD
jgi:dipicolinate synthase subunit A